MASSILRELVNYNWLKEDFLSEDPDLLGRQVPSNKRKALTYDDVLACTKSTSNKHIQITCSINNGQYQNNQNVIQRDLSIVAEEVEKPYVRAELLTTSIDPMGGATYTLRLYKEDNTYNDITDQSKFTITIDNNTAQVYNIPNNDGTTTQTSVVPNIINNTDSSRTKSVVASYTTTGGTTLTDTKNLTQAKEETFGYYNGTYGSSASWVNNGWLDDYTDGSLNTGLDPYIPESTQEAFGSETLTKRGRVVGENPLSVLGETAVPSSTRTSAQNFVGANSSDNDRPYHLAWRPTRADSYFIYDESRLTSSTEDCKSTVSNLSSYYISEDTGKSSYYTLEENVLSSVGTSPQKTNSNSLVCIDVDTKVTYYYYKPQHNYGQTAIKYAEYQDETTESYPFRNQGYPELYKFRTDSISDQLNWGSNSVDSSHELSFGSTNNSAFDIPHNNGSYIVTDQWHIPGEYTQNVNNSEYQYTANFFGLSKEICKREVDNDYSSAVINDTTGSDTQFLDLTTGSYYTENSEGRVPFNLTIVADGGDPWTKSAKSGTTIAYVNNSSAPSLFCPITIDTVYYDTGVGPNDYKLNIYKIFYPATYTNWETEIKPWVLSHKAYQNSYGTPETYIVSGVGTFTRVSNSNNYEFVSEDGTEQVTCIASDSANGVSLSRGRVYIPYSSYNTEILSYYSNETSTITVTNVDKIVVRCTPDDGSTYTETTFDSVDGIATATNIPAGIVKFDVYIGYSCLTVDISVVTGDKTLTGKIWGRKENDTNYPLNSGGDVFTWEELYQLTGNTKYQEQSSAAAKTYHAWTDSE